MLRHSLISVGLVGLLGLTSQVASAQPAASMPTASTAIASTADTTTSQTNASQKKVNLSPIFIQLSDAMSAVKKQDIATAKVLLTTIEQEFNALPGSQSASGKSVNAMLIAARANPTDAQLSALSKALYAFEKAQNPVDYREQRAQFSKKILPAYVHFDEAIQSAQPEQIDRLRAAYNQFNAVWLSNERVVRNTSMAHYGKIETALALIRVAIESQPMNVNQMQLQSKNLKQAIDSYQQGDTITQEKSENVTLASGIGLLREALSAYQAGDNAIGQAKIGTFINQWPVIEGDVSTRNPALYSHVESQLPLVMANGHDPKQQQNLQAIINELAQINPTARYTAVDSMLILLREGLEALLIIMALLSALTVAKQPKGKKWVYAGMLAGLLASVGGALALQQLFPTMTSGANREMLEGVIGIIAVIMMIGVGAWLHSKSSVQSWNNFIKRHMGSVLTTGSFVSLFGLSFVSVLREGAETILFYVGILPNILLKDFILGIVMALGVLAAVAIIMLKTSLKLPIPLLFKILTWVIYFLGFKILGVSLSALQLTGYLPRTVIANLPVLDGIGFYPTVQTIVAQILYIVAIIAVQWWLKRSASMAVPPKPQQMLS